MIVPDVDTPQGHMIWAFLSMEILTSRHGTLIAPGSNAYGDNTKYCDSCRTWDF